MLPLMIDLSGKKVLIFGGGLVGVRKARFFAPEADVTIVSRSFSPGCDELGVKKQQADLAKVSDRELDGMLDGAFIAVAATPDEELNGRIAKACRKKRILLNRAEGEPGDLLIPSIISGEHYLLAISTGGESPAMARFLREYIQSSLPSVDRMIALQARLRDALKKRIPDEDSRKMMLWNVLNDTEIWDALAKSEERAWKLVREKYC